jgi:putative nucleotidyltransferase with HDIG domain
VQLAEALEHLNQLPPLPEVLQEVVSSLHAKAVNVEELARRISLDDALTAKLLRVANSAFFGFPREVASVHDAIVILGLGGVQSLVLSAGLMQTFKGAGGTLDRVEHWKRSFRVAVYAQSVARCLQTPPAVAFTAGLLHDIGQLALDTCLPSQYAEACARAEELGGQMAAEQATLGFDHAALGAELARRWNFPAAIEQAIRDCHGASQACEPITCAVAVGIGLAAGEAPEATLGRIPESVKSQHGLDVARLAAVLPTQEGMEAGIAALMA